MVKTYSISAASVMNPLPTREVVHWAQMKQSLCQWRSSKEMNLAPPIPVIGFRHALQRLAKSSP